MTNYIFAATGNDGKIFKSIDGFAWELATNTSYDTINSLIEFNNSIFAFTGVAGGAAILKSSSIGTAWDVVTTTTENNLFVSTKFNNSLFVGSEPNGLILKSSDGLSWDIATNTTANEIRELITFNNSLFAGTDDTGKILISSDGLSWDIATNTGETEIRAFTTFNNSLFAGTANNGLILVSGDGLSWDIATDTTETYIYRLATYNNSLFAGTATNGLVLASGDGFTWNTITNTGEIGITSFTTYNNSLFAGTATNGLILASNNGLTWNTITNTGESFIYYFLVPSTGMIYGTQQLAQQFSFPKTASLNRVTMNLNRDNTSYTDANIIIEIQTNNTATNVPTGTLYASAKDNFSDSGIKSFYFENRPLIKKDTKYWIVARANDADIDSAYNWSFTTNTDNTRYSAVGNTWYNTTTAAYNFSAFVPHDRFNYQTRQGTTSTTVANLSAGEDFFFENIQTDMDRLFNDITVVGRGDGINQVSARALNTQSIALYGRRQQTIEEKSVSTNEDCQSLANNLITRYGEPVTVFDVSMEDPNIGFGIGDLLGITSIIGNLNNSSFRCITQEDYTDVTEDRIRLHLNNAKTSLGTEIDKLKKDKNLQHNYGQGATNLFQVATYENADKDTGEQLDIRFYMPDETKAINKVFLNLKVEAFRAYSSTAAGSSGAVLTFGGQSEDIEDYRRNPSDETTNGFKVVGTIVPPSASISSPFTALPFDGWLVQKVYKERSGLNTSNIWNSLALCLEDATGTGKTITTLNGSISDAVTTITVFDTSDYDANTQIGTPTTGAIRISNEIILYGSKTGTTFNNCTRGAFRTEALSHINGIDVNPASVLDYDGLATIGPRDQKIMINTTNNSSYFEIWGINALDISYYNQFLLVWNVEKSKNMQNDEMTIISQTQAKHTHDINFGIFPDPNFGYAGTSPYQAQVSGTDVLLDIKAGADGAESLVIENLTVNSSGVTDLEITPYITSGVGRWYNIQVFPNVPIRIEANVYSQIYIESK